MELNQMQDAGPGAKLKVARERQGLTIEGVAENLKLHHRLILAIESDDYSNEKILAPAFIRGYLRNYARLVNLSVDEIMDDFNKLGFFQDSECLLSPTLPNVGKFEPNVKRSYWLTVLLFLLFGAMGLGWYFYKHRQALSQAMADELLSKALAAQSASKEHGL